MPQTHTPFINATTTEPISDLVAVASYYNMDTTINHIAEGNGEVTKIDSKTGKPVEAAAIEIEETKPAAEEKPVEKVEEKVEEKPAAEPEPEAEEKPVEKVDPDELSEADRLKHKKLLKQIDKLTGRLRNEEDKSGKLADELEEAKSKLTGIKAPVVEDAAPLEPVAPKRPSRPKLADFAFDQEKYEVALDNYETKLDEYETARDEFTREAAAKKVREEIAEQTAQHLAQQREQEWNTAKSAYPDIDERLEESTGQISSSMQAVLRESYEPSEAWALLDYLADNPEESTRIAQATLASSAKPSAGEFSLLMSKATRELTKLESKIQRSKAAKEGASKKDDDVVKEQPTTTPTPKPKTEEPVADKKPVPAVTPKPPVSKAEPPITPVSSHADNTGNVDLSSDKVSTKTYMAEREKQRIDRLKRRG